MFLPEDEPLLRRAIRLAMNGRGRVEPNPMVGCVLARNGRIIGEGFHAQWGGPHAEPTALADAAARGESVAGATAYVTLEPCCHLRKKTPPCAPRLIAAGIARVVVGCLDPNPAVNGNGVAMLRTAGIQIDGPLLENECKQLIAPFLARVNHGRPYVTLKWAESSNGKVAGPQGRRVQISNATSTRLVHQLRARCDAILVGINTVLKDDPLLTARDVPAARPLARHVLDSWLRIPLAAQLVRTARDVPTRVYCVPALRGSERANELQRHGVEVCAVDLIDWTDNASPPMSLREVMNNEAGTHLLVEPGPTLAASLFAENVADRVWVFRSRHSIEGANAPTAAALPASFQQTAAIDCDGDLLCEYLNPGSSLFHAPVPSADSILAQTELSE